MTKHDDISIIGYDFPGFGGSTLPNYFFTFGNLHGFSIFCILKELGWEDAHIVGHSNGAELGSIVSFEGDNDVGDIFQMLVSDASVKR